MSTASALQAFIRPIRNALAAGASSKSPASSTLTVKYPVSRANADNTSPTSTDLADLFLQETEQYSQLSHPSFEHSSDVPGYILRPSLRYYTVDSGLYLQRLISAAAGAEIPEFAPEVTLDEVTRAYFEVHKHGYYTKWNPTLSDINLDGGSVPNAAILCSLVLRALYPDMPDTAMIPKRRHTLNSIFNVHPMVNQDSVSVDPSLRPKVISHLSLAQSALSTTSWSSGARTPAMLGVQPHIIALIDGDGYIFNKDLLLQGRQGGREAARLLATSIAESFNHRMDYRLSIYLFLNVAGTMGKLVASDLDTQFKFDVLRDFLSGFQAPPFNYVIDPGSGKERVDTKLKELFRVSLRAPDTECVVLGVSHDNGYLATIEGEVLFQSKIKLLNAGPDMVSERFKNDFPHLPIIKVPELFEWHSYPRESAESRAARKLEREVRSDNDTGDGPPRAENLVPAQSAVGPPERGSGRHGKEKGQDETAPRRRKSPLMHTKDRKAKLCTGTNPRAACKNSWIAKNPHGTESEFQEYWQTKVVGITFGPKRPHNGSHKGTASIKGSMDPRRTGGFSFSRPPSLRVTYHRDLFRLSPCLYLSSHSKCGSRFSMSPAACLMDMNVPTALSQTTKILREVSRFHRYHSVKLQGHEQLLAFEKQYSGVPEESRNVVNLLVTLPCLVSVAYARDGPGMGIADDEMDSTYESSVADSDSDGTMDIDSDNGSIDSSPSSGSGESDDDLEYEDMSTEETQDLRDEVKDIPTLLQQVPIPVNLQSPTLGLNSVMVWSDTLQPSDIGGRNLSQLHHLSTYQHRVPQTEFKVFSALRRILERASSSLKQFALFWEPRCDFNVDALFPVLPRLQSLAVFEVNQRTRSTYIAVKMIHQKFTAFPRLFPAVRRIDVNEIAAPHWASTLLMALTDAPSLQFATLPCKLVKAMLEYRLLLRLLPRSLRTLRIHCTCSAHPVRHRQCELKLAKPPDPIEFTFTERLLDKASLEREWMERRHS
ncbi:hypothetical protein NMY22_g3734 [Coprinellus aureogranulatus]|nr:hypothetical protein NMY22_g3734 [Coprinellus aureogranulatus]